MPIFTSSDKALPMLKSLRLGVRTLPAFLRTTLLIKAEPGFFFMVSDSCATKGGYSVGLTSLLFFKCSYDGRLELVKGNFLMESDA